MPTFQEIYNKHSAAISQGLISPDESLSTFAQRGFQVTGDPSYKNVADSGWFSNAIRSRSADLSNFVESGPVDEWTSEAVGRIGDLFGITPASSRAVGKKLPRMAVDYLPMAVGAALAVPTGGASVPIGLAATSGLSAGSAYEDTGRPLDAIIGGVAPYVGGKLSEVGTRAALNLAAKSPALQRLGFTGGTKLAGQALNKAEIDRLAAEGFDAATIAGTTAARTMLDKPLDKILGYVGGEIAANTGFTALDIAQQGTDAVFNRDYLFANLISNVPFAAVDMAQSARTRQLGDTEFTRPAPQSVYLTPGEERSVRAAAMFKDMEDPAQIEALKRRYGLDITNIELNAEKLRAAQMERTTGQELVTKDFVSRWNNYLESDPLFNQATNGSFRITQGGAFGKEIVGLDKVLEAKNLPAKAQELVDGFKDQRAVVKRKYSNVVSSMVKPASMEESLTRSVQELGLDEFLAKPVTERDYHTALKDSLLSPEGIDLVRDIHRFQAGEEPLNTPLFQEFLDFYSGKRTDLDFDKRVDLAVAVSLARGAMPKVKEGKQRVKEAEMEGQTERVVLEEGLKPIEETAREFVETDSKVQQTAKLAQAVKVEEDLKVEEQKVEQAKVEVRRLDTTPEELATARVNLDNQLRSFVAKAEEAKRLREEAAQVVQEPVTPVEPVLSPGMKILEERMAKMSPAGKAKWTPEVLKAAEEFFLTGNTKLVDGLAEQSVRNALRSIFMDVTPGGEKLLAKGDKVLEESVKLAKANAARLKAAKMEKKDVDPELAKLLKEYELASSDKDVVYLIPVPEGDFETVRPFAEKLMAKLVPAGEVKERSAELVELAKLFNNPEVAYAELGKMVKGKGDVQFARASDSEYLAAVEVGDMKKAQRMVDEAAKASGLIEVFRAVRGDVPKLEARPGYILTFSTRKEVADSYGRTNQETTRYFLDPSKATQFKKTGADYSKIDFDKAVKEGGFVVAKGMYDTGPFASIERDPKMLFSYSSDIYGMKDASGIIKSADPVTYNDAGNVIPLSQRFRQENPDIRFARASAGAFDFGMREVVDGKLIRPGKPALGTKDGWMTEQEFRVNGGDLGPLQKDEVAFYKQLVPEAFANDKVHLQKLWDGLGKVAEQVKVVTYGQDGVVSEAKQQFDRLVHDWFDNLTSAQRYAVASYDTYDREVSQLHNLDLAKIRQYRELREAVGNERGTGPRATSYYNQISPFDTQKFPVLRVDVVLPEGTQLSKLEQQELKELRNTKGNQLAGKLSRYNELLRQETLWQQDNLHENLPNTLGWAMVQIVPDPKTGEKVMFVGEAQSRWGQERQKAEKLAKLSKEEKEAKGLTRWNADKEVAPHPLLPIHQNLILKSVIKEAQKQGITKVAISDGETAMMTEGHDKATTATIGNQRVEIGNTGKFRPVKVGDWVAISRDESTKVVGESEEYLRKFVSGKDAKDYETFRPITEDDLRPAEPPQSGGMRLAYDTTMPSIMSKLVGEGEMRDFGVHKNLSDLEKPDVVRVDTLEQAQSVPNAVEYKQQLDGTYKVWTEKKGSPVFRNPDGTPKSSVTGRIYDISNPSERVNTLFAQNAGKVFGAASYSQKKIFINSEAFNSLNPAEKLGFIFAHEHAHISFAKALDGSYGPEARALAETAQRWVMTADPQAKQVVRDVLMDLHLPKELRDADGIREVLNNDDPNEWLANAMALYAGGAIKASKPKMAFAMLPKPIRNFFEWAIQGMQNLYKGAKTWMKLGGDKEKLKQVSTIKDLMDTIRRSYRQAEWDAREAEAFLRVQPEDMIEKATDLQFAKVSPSARTGGAVFKEEPVKWMKGVFDAWNNPLHTLARLHKAFVEPVLSVHQKHDRITNGIMEVEKTFFGGLSASGKVQIDSKAHERVFGSLPLKTLLNDIQRFAVQENKRVIQEGATPNTLEVNLGNLSPELRGKFAQFKPEAQQALVQVLASFEMANRKSQEIFKTGFLRESTARLAQMMQFKSSFNKADFGKAPEIAKGIMDDLLNGDPVLARSKLDMMDPMEADKLIESAQLLAQQHVKLADYYAKHPSYMSFRRFKKHKQRMEKPGVADDVVDADTPGELQKVVAEQVAKGWKPKGDPMVQDKKSKEQYRMNDELLQLIRQHDSEMLENMKTQGLTADQFDSLASMLNTEDLVARQINAKELYKPMGIRKFSGDLERFDALEQFMRYTPAAIHAVESRATEAEVNFWMQNPELKDLQTEKDQFKALYEQSKTPDPEWARKLAKANAVWHIGWNLPGHIAETAQPFLTHLPELITRGDGTVKGLARIMRAEKEMLNVQRVRTKGMFSKEKIAKYTYKQSGQKDEVFEGIPAAWLQANGTKGDNLEIARALEALSNRIQRAPMSEILNSFDSKAHTQLERLSRGEPLAKLGEIVAKPFNMYAKGAMTFYSQFPMHNAVVAIVSSYRQAREQGFSPKDAIAKAELFDLSVNNSSGRLERPEMFNKLGGAGHLVYQLSSYVRGRFADLATFYRHGWSDDQYNLTPTEKKNARKAFQTMVLAQVGAAGLLGLPFVGAGIALMEELLGEDIKGRMYEALDEVTEDPSLTRALTHGFASAFAESLGIPADMHSRFALSGFLGTNAYDGMSAKSFMGPSVAMLDSLWKLGGTMAQGKSVEEALTVAGPGGIKRLAEALSEDFQRDNPEASLAWSALGFRSTQMTKQKEFSRIVDRREMESRRELELAANRISDTLANPATARKTLFDEAMKLVPSGLNPLEQKQQLQQNIKDLAAKVSLLEANKVAPEDLRTQVAGRVAPQVANVGRSMGVQMNNPMELARSLAAQKTRSVLGQPLSQRPVRNAMMRDLQWGANPWEF